MLPRQERIIYSRFGRLLARYRKNAGLSQDALASSVGLSRTSITNIECGRQPVQLHSLYTFADALNIRVGELLPATPNIRLPLELKVQDIPELNVTQAEWIRSIARIKPFEEQVNYELDRRHTAKSVKASESKSNNKTANTR